MRELNVKLTPLAPQEIAGGASDNTIDASNNAYAVVNGGAGNDVLQGGALLYGGEGNDTLSGGGRMYGGNERMRWRTHAGNLGKSTAANDETTQAWRVAA